MLSRHHPRRSVAYVHRRLTTQKEESATSRSFQDVISAGGPAADGDIASALRAPNAYPGPLFEEEEESAKTKWIKRAKLVLPHVGLVTLSCAYTILGATMFYFIERPYELKQKEIKMINIQENKNQIAASLWTISRQRQPKISESEWNQTVQQQLHAFMQMLFKSYEQNLFVADDFDDNFNNFTYQSRWTYTSALFFSATVITTIGYGHLVPATLTGKVLCCGFGLLGIPLVLVTVADLGKFLAEYVMMISDRFHDLKTWCRKKTQHWLSSKKSRSSASSTRKNGMDNSSKLKRDANLEGLPEVFRLEDFAALDEPKISVLIILAILTGYISFGAFLLQLWEDWSFFDSFYYCFITVTTIGFGDIVPRKVQFLWVTLLFIVIGLVLTTMCIDMTGSAYIRKIHYFGRNIEWARYALLAMGDKMVSIGDVIRFVSAMQRSYGIGPDEIEKFGGLPEAYLWECIMRGKPIPAYFKGFPWLRPYIPSDIHLIRFIDKRGSSTIVSARTLASMESVEITSGRGSSITNYTARSTQSSKRHSKRESSSWLKRLTSVRSKNKRTPKR